VLALAPVSVVPVPVELVGVVLAASSAFSKRVEDVTMELSVVEVVAPAPSELNIVAVGDAVIELLVAVGGIEGVPLGADTVGILMSTSYAEHSVLAKSMTAGSLSQAVDQRNRKTKLVGTYLQLR
jgi:hypothetical protein